MHAKQTAGYISAPPQARRAPPRSKKSVGGYVSTAVFVAFVIVALLVTDIRSQIEDLFNGNENEGVNNPPTLSPTAFGETRAPTPEQVLFPNEIRNGNNYVGLFLLNQMSDAAFSAFQSAADKWSDVVAGSTVQTASFGGTSCQISFPQTIFFDHLIIAAQVAPIDGVGSVLGSAGPCLLTNRPIFGQMKFDEADIQNLINQGAVESVILHEMGHVLGIGTLWSNDRFNLLQDPVFGAGGIVNANNQPKMTGSNAVAQYRLLTGNNNEQFVPVEDGTTNGQDIFNPKSNGQGSIDGHWDEDFFLGELMAFSINTNGSPPPMSATTIASLADFGYQVNLALAESYSVARAKGQRLRGEGTHIEMINDIHSYVPIYLAPDN